MPQDDQGRYKGIAFITFKTKEAVEKALKFDGDDYGGRPLKVAMSTPRGDKGKGKGDGKGKGKDKGKGKGKDKGKGKGKDFGKGKGKGKGKDKGKGKGKKSFDD